MKKRNWFWGIYFLAAAIFVIASQTDSFIKIGFFSILASIFLIAALIHSVAERSFFGILVPAALLYMIFETPLHLPEINNWLLLLAAMLGSIGLGLIFPWKNHGVKQAFCKHNRIGACSGSEAEVQDDNHPYIKVHFGAASRYLHGDCIQDGQLISSFGALEVYFDQARLDPAGAAFYVDCSFGAVKLFVPRDWEVVDHLRTSMAGVDSGKRAGSPAAGAPRLVLNGSVRMGGLEIQYI